MSWITLPNKRITDVRGQVVKTAKLDDDLEIVYKPIRCPTEECDARFTNLEAFQDHVLTTDHDRSGRGSPAREERIPLDTAHLIFQVLSVLRNAPSDSPISKLRKVNDSMHAERTWARAWISRDTCADLKLHTKQYEWLQALLARTLPLSKEDKAGPLEAQTVAEYLFGLSWYQYMQALTIVSDRVTAESNEPPDSGAVAAPSQEPIVAAASGEA